jgi:DMSO reductase anchor subunit
LLFAAAGGLILASFFAFAASGQTVLLSLLAVLFIIGAWAAKARWRERMRAMMPLSTPESATGLGNIGHVRLLERPHATENYLTNEMGFKVARKHAEKLWRIALMAGGIVPAILLVALVLFGTGHGFSTFVAALAVLSFYAGMLVERWLFFAEARHAVMNYYGG